MRKVLWVASFLALFSCSISADTARSEPRDLPDDFCDALFTLEEPVFGSMKPVKQFLDMELEGLTLPIKLPRNYLEDMWDFNEGYTVPSHAFRVDIDTFDPIKTRDLKAFLDEHGQRSLNILISDVISLSKVLETAILLDLQNHELFGGLIEQYEPELGLTRIEPADPHPNHTIIFTAKSVDGEITDVLSCRRPGDGVNQRCRHNFRVHNVDVNAGYDDEHLPSWQIIKSNVATFLGCMLSIEEKSK